MNIRYRLSHCITLALVVAMSACVSNKPKSDRPSAAPADSVAAGSQLPPGHMRAIPPRAPAPAGDWWPPAPVDENAVAPPPAPKMPSSDDVVLDAKRNPKAELKQRTIERWAMLIGNRADVAFEYLTPGYQKTHDKAKYASEMAGRPVRWFRAAFDHLECASEDACVVTLLVDFRVRLSAGMGVTESFAFVKEHWIATNGVWYHLPSEVGG